MNRKGRMMRAMYASSLQYMVARGMFPSYADADAYFNQTARVPLSPRLLWRLARGRVPA